MLDLSNHQLMHPLVRIIDVVRRQGVRRVVFGSMFLRHNHLYYNPLFSLFLDKNLYYTSSPKGNDAHLRAIMQSEKKWKHKFFRRLRVASSVVRGQIWLNFKLIQAVMYVIITLSMKRIPSRTTEAKWQHSFQILTLSVAMETSGQIWPNFELIQAFIHSSLPASMKRIR